MTGLTGLAGLSFAHPLAGALALLGIPAVLAIHFLQLPSRPVAVSTLFLLDRLDPKSVGGSRLQRLRQSVPLWLQLLAVLLLAWLLSEPRWLRPDSAQTVAVVVDSSLSMRAFAGPLRERLPQRLRLLARSAEKTQWLLLESDPVASRLYAGSRLEDLQAALAEPHWRPRLGTHDPSAVLRLAQSLVQDRGVVVFVTDRKPAATIPVGVELFAVGRPIENAGFCGARVNVEGWEALVKNYGSRPQSRSWWMETKEGQRFGESTLTLQPGQSETLRGRFPDGSGAVRLVLGKGEDDSFALDDRLPLLRPEPKRLRVQVTGSRDAAQFAGWLDPFFRSEPALERVAEKPDLQIALYDPFAPALPVGPAIVFIQNPAAAKTLLPGSVVAERDPLLAGLSWDGLLAGEGFGFPRKPGDAVLLWQGERPLVLRRGAQLLVSFDPAQSNAARLPAFVLLLHRFVESVRAGVVAPEAGNFETNQPLQVAGNGGTMQVYGEQENQPSQEEQETRDTKKGLSILRAPAEPGYFEVREAKGTPAVAVPLAHSSSQTRLKGAAHFADTREADFRDAVSQDGIAEAARRQRERYSRQDGLTPAWLLLLGAVMAANWSWKSWGNGGSWKERRKSS